MVENNLEDQFYRRSVKPHPSGGYQLRAEALAAESIPASHPSYWACTHDDGEFHASYEDAIDCVQYRELLGQIT
jgi:hypothetical protein